MPLLVLDPVLMETLAVLDRDVSGETKFCQQAADALRAFQARWAGDVAMEDGYGQAIKALDTMRSILAGAEVRWREELTRKVRTRQAAEHQAATATAEREHAFAWAEQPVPVPESGTVPTRAEATPAPHAPRRSAASREPVSTEPPPEAGVRE
jgi:hypothetical protein